MPTKYRDLSPEARERAKAKARAYYHQRKDDPSFIQTRRDWYQRKKETNPGWYLGKYQKNPERNREYARKVRAANRILSGSPGSIRYEAKMAGFRSGFERSVDINLRSRNIEYTYEPTRLPYTLKAEYIPDLYFPSFNFYVEVKGVLSVEDRRKMRAIKEQYPEIDIRFCFMREGTRIKHGKQTNEEWARKNGFPFCFENIPEEWFNG